MKFLELTKMLKNLEENKNSLLLVKCGAFFVAIKEDALWLSINLKLKKTCMTDSVCKVGIPINSIYSYIDELERANYSFVIYNYSKEILFENGQKYKESYRFKGKNIQYENITLNCEKCEYYKKHKSFDNIDIFETLKRMQKEKEKYNSGKE